MREFVFALIVLILLNISYAQTIGIGIIPASVNTTSRFYNFCFFNKGDTDAVYKIISGSIKVEEMEFVVPANTNIQTCIKKTIYFYGKNGTFYIEAYPLNYNYSGNVVYRVGVNVNSEYEKEFSNIFFLILSISLFILFCLPKIFKENKKRKL